MQLWGQFSTSIVVSSTCAKRFIYNYCHLNVNNWRPYFKFLRVPESVCMVVLADIVLLEALYSGFLQATTVDYKYTLQEDECLLVTQ